jgi:shikimate kinase
METNICLIGMPSCGKSTVGVLLAKASGLNFVDTDVVIQAREGRSLQTLIAEEGLAGFREIEERAVLALDVSAHVIATGGSVIYSEAGMAHLKAGGVVVYLDRPLDVIRQHVGDTGRRGVVMRPGQTLDALYAERQPLYERWADVRIDCGRRSHEAVVDEVMDRVFRREERGSI